MKFCVFGMGITEGTYRGGCYFPTEEFFICYTGVSEDCKMQVSIFWEKRGVGKGDILFGDFSFFQVVGVHKYSDDIPVFLVKDGIVDGLKKFQRPLFN